MDLVFNEGALHALLSGQTGAVARDLAKRAIRVESAAKRRCPVDTGRLRMSITWKMDGGSFGGISAIVGTNVEYAVYVHEGTRPHEIRGNPWLYWKGAAHPVRSVQHPGTRANRFLVDALPAAG